MVRLIYDGSFEGLLTAVFEVYEYRYATAAIVPDTFENQDMFAEEHVVSTDSSKAERVEKSLEKYGGHGTLKDLLRVHLSEDPHREQLILYAIRYMLKEKTDIFKNFADENILRISKLVKSVRREKHRMEAFIRFRQLADGSFYAYIEPDFDVLPLILPHFRARYADQHWMIYDLRRNYGILYNLNSAEFFTPDDSQREVLRNPNAFLHETEKLYETLWQNYFRSTNIVQRRNPKLHLRHIPKRYWKYLSEKQ